jgi:hypothetical protein
LLSNIIIEIFLALNVCWCRFISTNKASVTWPKFHPLICHFGIQFWSTRIPLKRLQYHPPSLIIALYIYWFIVYVGPLPPKIVATSHFPQKKTGDQM